MKLTTDFTGLWEKVRQMGEFHAGFSLEEDVVPEFEIDKNLSSTAGLDVTLDDLEFDRGVLSVEGRQVLLFIPDQGRSIEEVLSGEQEGRKFHVADCKTLNSMRQNNRFNRYKATYNTSGLFKIYGVSYPDGESIEGEASLKVCKNCLSYLNYRGYKQGGNQPKSVIYNEFGISEFLSQYSTLFTSMPDRPLFVEKGGYSDDWADISNNYRDSVGFCCEQCGVDLASKKSLLHTHHISGNKRENNFRNLKALCIDCHRKQPLHEYMRIKHEDMVYINQLRRKQGLLCIANWDDVLNLSDKALEGLLRFYKKQGYSLPEVGYELSVPGKSMNCELEVAWPSLKFGIAVKEQDSQVGRACGWKIKTIGKAFNEMNE